MEIYLEEVQRFFVQCQLHVRNNITHIHVVPVLCTTGQRCVAYIVQKKRIPGKKVL